MESLEENFVDEKVESPNITHHHHKFAIIEDAFNGLWLTMDESCTPGWYKGPITHGPEPMPVHTGATMHTICITDSPLVQAACSFVQGGNR